MANGATANDEPIVAINVTPLVDVVLVLLIVLMVAATSLVAQGLSVDLPRASSGEVKAAPLSISLDKDGKLFLDGKELTLAELQQRTHVSLIKYPEMRAVIDAD